MTTPKLHGYDNTSTDYCPRLPIRWAPFVTGGWLHILFVGLLILVPLGALAQQVGVVDDTNADLWFTEAIYGTGDEWSQPIYSTRDKWGDPIYREAPTQQGARARGWLVYLLLAFSVTLICWRHIVVSLKTSWQSAVENYSAHLAMLDEERAVGASAHTLGKRFAQLILMPPTIFFWVLAGAPELQRLWRGPGL